MRRTVKIKFIDYWSSFYKNEIENCLIMRILQKHYDVIVCDDADYVFFSTMGESHWSVDDNCIKIFQTGENLAPDFNACDYAIGFEWMDYEDRYIRFPNYMFYEQSMLHKMEQKHILQNDWNIKTEKPEFCSFVVSNPRNSKRKIVFDRFSEYKRVDSGGKYLNNVGGPVADKFAFDSKHKFAICFENGSHNGYTTEKLVQAFAAQTVPIYWGDPKVGMVFNKKAFINAEDYKSLDELLLYVKEVDNNDELYARMLKEPAMNHSAPSISEELDRFEKWLLNIFEQPIEDAKRRNREMHGRWYKEKRYQLDRKANRTAIKALRRKKYRKATAYVKHLLHVH